MPMISMRQLLDHARENNYGIPAFNINCMEQLLGVVQAAAETDSPLILQSTLGYGDIRILHHQVMAVTEMHPYLPVCLNLDHGSSLDICARALTNGFTSVMRDGSLMEDKKTPATYEFNVEQTRKVVQFAHACGMSVEGEIGVIGSLETGMAGKEDGHGAEGKLDHSQLVTSPEEAASFVKDTHVDALAIACGTSHGAHKFTRKPDSDILNIDIIQKIAAKIPNTPLVMHGASSVPEELRDKINKFGGDLKETYGVPHEAVIKAIKFGICKVNIDTDSRMAFTAAVREVIATKPEEFDPRKYLIKGQEAQAKICKQYYEMFGAAGQASKIKAIPLPQMAKMYKEGRFDPVIK